MRTEEERTLQQEENLLAVVFVEPHKKPVVRKIRNEYEDISHAVGGLIEHIYQEDGTILVANEESKLLGMDGNRRIMTEKASSQARSLWSGMTAKITAR